MDSYDDYYDRSQNTGVTTGASGGEGDARSEPEQKGDAPTSNPHIDTKYVQELNAEKTMLDHETFPHSIRLVSHEINRVTLGGDQMLDLFNDKPTKVAVKVKVPIQEYPKFNFIGKLLGPKGNTLKRIQDETGCRMAVYGRGSMRDKDKEEELRLQGGKYAHLSEDLHVYIESYGHPIDVHRRISMALYAVRRHLVPDYNDDITQSQVQELAYLNGRGPVSPRVIGPPPMHMLPSSPEFPPPPYTRPPFTDMRGGRGPRGPLVARGGLSAGNMSSGVRRGGVGQYGTRGASATLTSPTPAAVAPSAAAGYDHGLSSGLGAMRLSGSLSTGKDFYNNNIDNFSSKPAPPAADLSSSPYGHMGR